ncbi:MAG: ABC transporter ATP-binding protein [Sporichthyaceae bacterium]
MSGLACQGLCIRAGSKLLLEVDELQIPAGECLAVLGPNGAGKSTLLRALGLLSTHNVEGQVLLDGKPMSAAEMRKVAAAVLQRPILRRGSVLHNVASGLRFRGIAQAEAHRRVEPWLAALRLAPLVDRDVRTLSGGEAQRVSLARALVLKPRVLLLDEPFSALDATTRSDLLADLRAALDGLPTATLLVSHDRHEALALAARTALLLDGRIRQCGPTAQVFDNPVDEATAALIGYTNRLPAAATSAAGPRVARPEMCRVLPGDALPEAAAGGLLLRGTVRRVVPLGVATRVDVEITFSTVACLHTLSSIGHNEIAPGAPVVVQVLDSRPLG